MTMWGDGLGGQAQGTANTDDVGDGLRGQAQGTAPTI